MNSNEIKSILRSPYNRENWKNLYRNIFQNKVTFFEFPHSYNINEDIVESLYQIGYATLDDEYIVALFEVNIKSEVNILSKKIGLRKVISKYISDDKFNGVLTIFENGSLDYRFTFASKTTKVTESGILVSETESKRYTYILGGNEPCLTPAQRFENLLNKNGSIRLDDIKEAFSVDKLNKEFFNGYKVRYESFCNYFNSTHYKHVVFNGDEKLIRDFVKKFLGRIVFLYFVQKKGWLGVGVNKEWGSGDNQFLSKLFNDYEYKDTFYSNILSRIFFDYLSVERSVDSVKLFDGFYLRIPYLNGGLFEREDLDYKEIDFHHSDLKSLFSFFDSFNFTIYEDDPDEHTVAVDPEMLGHIFENLLEENKDKGAFYTPKEIVHYMCQESLIEYLITYFEEKGHLTNLIDIKSNNPKKQINREIIEQLLKREISTENKNCIESFVNEFHIALDTVKICDPAIGSGAFPMGLLHEIYTTKQTLHIIEHGDTQTFDSTLVKLNIIQNSIYGVDIEKGAVDIARLRFWLSLIVDEDKPKPLPNLDYKIVVGNSLVSKIGQDIIDIDWSLDETSHGLFSVDLSKQKIEILNKISKKQKIYFNTENHKRKISLEIRELKIDLIINQLQLMIRTRGIESKPSGLGNSITRQTEIYLKTLRWKNSIKDLQTLKNNPNEHLDYFDWKLDFPEVLNEKVNSKPGFDIVIGNPPYIGQKGNKDLFEPLKTSSKWSDFYERKQDIYYYFISLGIKLLSKEGNLTYIIPPYFLTATGGGNLRDFIIKNSYINKIMNLSESVKVFDNASINSIIIFLSKNKKYLNSKIKIFEPNLISKNSYLTDPKLSQSKFSSKDLTKGEWFIFKKESTLEFINGVIKLGSISTISPGIQTGCDKVTNSHIDSYKLESIFKDEGIFIISDEEYRSLNLTENEREFIKPFYKNSSISKWTYNEENKHWIIVTNYISNIDNYPNIKKHLNKFREILDNRYRNFALLNADKEGKWWYLYGYRPNTNFDGEKIILPYRAVDNSFCFSDKPFYASIDVFFININNHLYSTKFITCILCSKLIEYWLNNNCKRKGKILELYQKPLSEIPIKEASKEIQLIFVNYVDEIIHRKSKNLETLSLENKINSFVYKLYELSFEDVIKIDLDFSLSLVDYENLEII